jgi:polysaccharide deacetylase 2 family uncharacterized protein YibQ
VAKAAKPKTSKPAGTRGSKGPRLLLLAWLLLAAGLGGLYAWNVFGPHDGDDDRLPPEPYYVELPEPEPPPPPPVAEAPPPLPEPAEVKEMASVPAVEPPPAPATPPPAATATPARPGAPTPPPPRGRPETPPPTAGAPPPQVATAVTPPAPAGPVPTWQRFARPFDANDARPRIAVVVVELGLSTAATEAAIQHLPGPVTLAFSPYADGLEQWLNLARAAGHEVMLGLPMEPANFPLRDPGPRTLLTSLSPQQNLERLDWVLGRASGIVGVTNHMGSRFTASADALRPVMTRLRDRGLMFVDARTTPRSVAAGLATTLNLPRAINDRLIDQEASRASIDALLADVEKVAKETGNAVALGQPYPVTFERLNAWLPTLEGKGLALAPITALVNRQSDR